MITLNTSIKKIPGLAQSKAKKIFRIIGMNPKYRNFYAFNSHYTDVYDLMEHYTYDFQFKNKLKRSLLHTKRISCYRGIRQKYNLPSRGQRTRTNARTCKKKAKQVQVRSRDFSVNPRTVLSSRINEKKFQLLNKQVNFDFLTVFKK